MLGSDVMHYGNSPEDDSDEEEYFTVQVSDDDGEILYEEIIVAYTEADAIEKAIKDCGLDPVEYQYEATWLENYAAEKDIDWDGDLEREESGP